jgi:hypothetical protein
METPVPNKKRCQMNFETEAKTVSFKLDFEDAEVLPQSSHVN